MNKKIVVVGGGIAGIFSALLYRRKGHAVTLIEKEQEIGGLLKSQCLFDNYFYDYGTHFLRETGIEEVDQLLFENLEVEKFPYLKVGSYYKELYQKNGFLSTHVVNNEEQYIEQLIEADRTKSVYSNLEEQLISNFGVGFATDIMLPVVKKFFFTEPKDLINDAHLLFGLGRLIVGSSEQTVELKKNKAIDNVVAYHNYDEGISGLKSLYPKHNGVGNWVTYLENELANAGVEVITGVTINTIVENKGIVEVLELPERKIELDQLIWTIPPFFLLKMLGVNLQTSPPKRLTSCIFHFLIDKKYLTDLHYFQCFDPDFKSFRVTLYDNFSKGSDTSYRISVEVLEENNPTDIEQLQGLIFRELIDMKVIPNSTKVINQSHNIYPNGFPVLTKKFVEDAKKQSDALQSKLSNLKLYGKAKGTTWFMNDIIHDIYKDGN